jgi:hypothetical protein
MVGEERRAVSGERDKRKTFPSRSGFCGRGALREKIKEITMQEKNTDNLACMRRKSLYFLKRGI